MALRRSSFTHGGTSASDGRHYEAEVNKKDINMQAFTTALNERWRNGWALGHVFEQDGNTVVVWERRDDDAEPSPMT